MTGETPYWEISGDAIGNDLIDQGMPSRDFYIDLADGLYFNTHDITIEQAISTEQDQLVVYMDETGRLISAQYAIDDRLYRSSTAALRLDRSSGSAASKLSKEFVAIYRDYQELERKFEEVNVPDAAMKAHKQFVLGIQDMGTAAHSSGLLKLIGKKNSIDSAYLSIQSGTKHTDLGVQYLGEAAKEQGLEF